MGNIHRRKIKPFKTPTPTHPPKKKLMPSVEKTHPHKKIDLWEIVTVTF